MLREPVFYVAQPAGRSPTEFALQELTSSRVVFANPAHDFPLCGRGRGR
jgi:hypothetical protein